jgi:hypothetical protein
MTSGDHADLYHNALTAVTAMLDKPADVLVPSNRGSHHCLTAQVLSRKARCVFCLSPSSLLLTSQTMWAPPIVYIPARIKEMFGGFIFVITAK